MTATPALRRLEHAVGTLEKLIASLPAPARPTAIDPRLEDYEALKSRHALLRSRTEAALGEVERLLGHDPRQAA